MSGRTPHRSTIRLLRYPARPGHSPRTTSAVDGSLALATGPPYRPSADTELAITAEVIVRLCVEVFAGRRPFRHLTGWVTLQVWEELAEHRPSVRTVGRVPPPRILTSWIQTPVSGEAETGAVAQLGDRVHAIALRLERFRARWRCRTLETTIPSN